MAYKKRYKKKTYKKKQRTYKKKRALYKRGKKSIASNPGWNPQYFKLKQTFQYSGPNGDVLASRFIIEDPFVLTNSRGVSNTTSYSGYAFTFRASDIPNITNYSSRFDQYKITYIVVRLEYMNAVVSTLQTQTSEDRIKMLIWTDNDDKTAPASDAATWQKTLEIGRAKGYCFPNNYKNQIKYVVRPKVLVPAVDAVGGTSGRFNGRSMWLDGSTINDVEHYALKFMIQGNPQYAGEYHYFRMTTTYYVKFRQRNL